MLIEIGAIVAVVVLAAVFFLSTYTVIPPNEAHVIVFMGRGRKFRSPVTTASGVDGKTSYFYIPFLMKRYIMPLTNVKLDINNIPLNDKMMAPFLCDVMTWLHIEDPVKAAERLDFTTGNVFGSLHQDLIAIVQAIARATSMNQEILDIMKDRKTFSANVSKEVDNALESWGVSLVNLEVNDIRDGENSAVISNYELQRKAQVESLTRKEVSLRNREAVEAEQENLQKAEVAKAGAEQTFMSKQIARDTEIGLRTQDKEQQIALAAAETNKKKVDALRVTTVGEAEITRDAAIETARGIGESIRIQGEKEAAIVSLKGKAEGEAIEARGLAEAVAKLKMAEALQKFNDAATTIAKIQALVDVQKAYAEAYGKIAENADIKVVTSGEGGNILGLPMNAKTGADFGQMFEALGIDLSKVPAAVKTLVGKDEK